MNATKKGIAAMLKKLYNGTLVPSARPSRENKEKREVYRQIATSEKYLFDLFDKIAPDDKERLKALLDLHAQLEKFAEEEVFSYAYSLGALFMVEVYEECRASDSLDLF